MMAYEIFALLNGTWEFITGADSYDEAERRAGTIARLQGTDVLIKYKFSR